MSELLPGLDLSPQSTPDAPVGCSTRFVRRWRVVGFGLSNVWRFGDLEMPTPTGRLLLRGTNGTGKTTALEAMWPYLLDLNATRLGAGKGRATTLSLLMREGATGRRRVGYVWFTISAPQEGNWSFGVRLQYSDGASPPVKVIPFAIPGRPLHELSLHGPAKAPINLEQFEAAVLACGGQIFADEDTYLAHLSVRIFGTPDARELTALAARLRNVRNPTMLGDVSPDAAAAALRDSLPSVAEEVINATAEALAESETTRSAFALDKEAADLLEDFRSVWCGHATDVVASVHSAATAAANDVRQQEAALEKCSVERTAADQQAEAADKDLETLESQITTATAEIKALENHQAYEDAGRLGDLKKALKAQDEAASAAAETMCEAARGALQQARTLRQEVRNIATDVQDVLDQAVGADANADPGVVLVSWTDRPRGVLSAGEITADPGPGIAIHGGGERLRRLAATWSEMAVTAAARADKAALALIDHRPVEKLQQDATSAATVAATAATNAAGLAEKAATATRQAADAARALLPTVEAWTRINADLANKPATDGADIERDAGASWELADIEQLAYAEPSQVVATADSWAHGAMVRAERMAAGLRARVHAVEEEEEQSREEAKTLRQEAAEFRRERLLPLPRPDWAGTSDDALALGTALDWAADFDDPQARALLEAALAATGLLGASLADSGARTRYWRVEAAGPIVQSNLSQVIKVTVEHPLAELASNVIARVTLADTAHAIETTPETAGVVVGRDGTFRAGVLYGRVPGADDPEQLLAARYVGARQRREAALIRAGELERQAASLELHADALSQLASRLSNEAVEISARGTTFPSRDKLRGIESNRAGIVRLAQEAQRAADEAKGEEERRVRVFRVAQKDWEERTRAIGLPIDLTELSYVRDTAKSTADQLRRAATPLRVKLAERLDRAIAQCSDGDIAERMSRSEAAARTALRLAEETRTSVGVLEATSGAAIRDVLERLEVAHDRRKKLDIKLSPARKRQSDSSKRAAAAVTNLLAAEKRLAELVPVAAEQLRRLRELLAASGVGEAVLDGDAPVEDDGLLVQVTEKLQGRRRSGKKTLRERTDTIRAKLAGVWSLDPTDDQGDLLGFVITHRDVSYTPTQAAIYARTLKDRAERALAASEERALSEFVVGRLPSAIGTAWTRLGDWIDEVNQKMRSATASSGVGVQVRKSRREKLGAAHETIFRLSCEVTDADRTPEQKRKLGETLLASIGGAEGETLQQRVAAAVDVRDWIDVHYEVTRPNEKPKRWGSRTGLSSGERRLVVLAPMLAAVAAGYDRFGEKALRLVPLDEIPVEVDERGREGLARFIAHLDLDLICTSYAWDGCPGAWDGIDAWDLEAGQDGTVVGFPMLVRGSSPIPGDTLATPGSEPADTKTN